MEDQLITFKIAKLAKEKGFDIIQRYGMEASLYNKKGEHTYYANYGVMYSGLSDGYISAPTQSLLQKWLREKHNLYISINMLPNFKYIYSIYNCDKINPPDLISTIKIPRKTYEEALEVGLQQALKLIPVTK